MWNCLQVEDSLSLYVDGLLSPPDRGALEAHVGSCPSCADHLAAVVEARDAIGALPDVPVPEHLFSRIVCSPMEEGLAALVGGDVEPSERDRLLAHIGDCAPCRELHGAIADGLSWARTFPEHAAPASLVTRILDETARPEDIPVPEKTWVRETWLDTLSLVARWLMEPRTAMMALTSVLVMGWMSSVAGVRPDIRSLSNPAALFDSVESIAVDVYDEGVRLYYSVPHAVVGEVQARIEQLREESL